MHLNRSIPISSCWYTVFFLRWFRSQGNIEFSSHRIFNLVPGEKNMLFWKKKRSVKKTLIFLLTSMPPRLLQYILPEIFLGLIYTIIQYVQHNTKADKKLFFFFFPSLSVPCLKFIPWSAFAHQFSSDDARISQLSRSPSKQALMQAQKCTEGKGGTRLHHLGEDTTDSISPSMNTIYVNDCGISRDATVDPFSCRVQAFVFVWLCYVVTLMITMMAVPCP